MKDTLRRHMINRNIRFWGSYAEKNLLLAVGMSMLYDFVFFGFSSESKGRMESVLFYIIMLGVLFMTMIQFQYATGSIPLALSFGAGRRECVWGIQFANAIFYIQMLAAFAVPVIAETLNTPQGGRTMTMKAAVRLVGIFSAVLLLAAAVGQFCIIVCFRFGVRGGGAFLLVAYLLVVLPSVLFSVFMVGMGRPKLAGNERITQLAGISAAVCMAVAAMLYAAGVFLLLKKIRNYEVCR